MTADAPDDPHEICITVDGLRATLTIGPAVLDLTEWREATRGVFRAQARPGQGAIWRHVVLAILNGRDWRGMQV